MRMLARPGALVLVLLSATRLAAAADDTDSASDAVKEARAVFQQGVQSFREGDTEGAVAEFLKAYRLSPSYRILYNIGQAYYELHDYVSSLRSLRQYLADGAAEIAPARRAEVEAFNQKLESKIGHVDIEIDVDGAEVHIDDVSVGAAPLPFSVAVNPGPRRVSAAKAGYTNAVKLVTVAGGDKITVALKLAKESSTVPQQMPSQVLSSQTQSIKTPAVRRSQTALAVSIVAAGACAAGAAVFGTLALGAKHDFDHELRSYPTSKDRIDTSRARMVTYSVLTDVFAVTALAATGLSAYYFWSGNRNERPKARASNKRAIVYMPTFGGMAVEARW